MVRYCLNFLTLTHCEESKVDEVTSAYNGGRLLSFLLPEPKSMHSKRADKPLLVDWRRDNWGTEQDVIPWPLPENDFSVAKKRCDCCGYYQVTMIFETLDAPPFGAYRVAHATHGFAVNATHLESGTGYQGEYRSDSEGEFQH